ncbi:hypothetical protein NDN11_15435 [Acinetobacter sp. C26M]|uniref:hypothetical protein n=1 Tax=unclassified Acinetobacter TaxID=196816 RepID=UPI001421DC2F|nr:MULTISPECIES: hypothetical protein [unclassified Acinetobacter]NIE97495.1 hypothetical protein [Acinetobacter sp. Tr-809]USA46078.1 hypothetical protein NDN11_15435 [Acinetobacter sp. C26M]USA49562.1 hypothetical protein NDN12_15350 [Acinetobacter sp. C26G]
MKRYYFAAVCAALLLGGCTSTPTISNQVDIASADEGGAATDAAIAAGADQDDSQYGGIKKQYVVKGCKVTIYNDGPVQMVNEKTDQPCNAPIPKDHQFSKTTRTYQENGCTITESIAADGLADAVMDCSKKNKNK